MAYLKVRVTPGARDDFIAGWQGDVLRLRVRATAQKGKANEAVCGVIAAKLGLARSLVRIARGAASREKLLVVEGLTDAESRARLGQPML